MQNNPLEAMAMNMLRSNPRSNELLPIIQQIAGKNPKEAEQYVRNYCNTKQLDIENAINLARQMNIPL